VPRLIRPFCHAIEFSDSAKLGDQRVQPPLFGPSMPVPLIDSETREFWEACKNHRLVVQQCTECGSYRFAPAPLCYACRSLKFRWIESDGVGEVYTWTVIHRSVHPATEEAVPYNTVVVRLFDCGGAMITSNLIKVDNDKIEAGMVVRVAWDDISDECALPRFEPVPSASPRK
jgi:uncharacterized OB-fold protein